jgi:hypothetical protein
MYVLFVIDVGTRRLHLGGVTTNPDGCWVAQAARNKAISLGEAMPSWRFLIRDCDARFSRPFDEVFATEGVRVIRTPVRAPRANPFAERWVDTLRRECLDWILVRGRRHLVSVLHECLARYNAHRRHRSLCLCPPDPGASRREVVPPVRPNHVVGGIVLAA